MITDYTQIQGLFVELDGHMRGTATVYMIGGGALMKREMKSQTKDIDIVVDSKVEFDRMQDAFGAAGFRPTLPTKEYDRSALSQIWIRDDFRVDIFCKMVCGRFSLSEGMKERSVRDDIRSKNIDLFVCSPEDIFLFKTMTDREGDYDDCSSVVRSMTDFEWSVVLNEAQEQSKEGQAVWITWITNRLEEFAERKMDVPILADMIKLADRYIEEWERGLLERNSDKA